VQAVARHVVFARIRTTVDHFAFELFDNARWDVLAVNVSPVVADSAVVVLDLVSANCFGFGCHLSVSGCAASHCGWVIVSFVVRYVRTKTPEGVSACD
jgi:hypothetical protein